MTELERLERIIDESLLQAAAAEARLIEMLKDLPPHRTHSEELGRDSQGQGESPDS
jgi:hypothetical protein